MYDEKHDWDQIQTISEEFYTLETPLKNIEIKKQAIEYLGIENKHLNRTELRLISSKANKIKTSCKKEERYNVLELEKQVQGVFNFHK